MGNDIALSGKLSFMSLPDIFQVLGGSNRSGILRITAPWGPDRGEMYFSKGNPVNAVYGRLKGIDAIYALFGWIEGRFEFEEKEVQTERLVKQSRMQIVLDALRRLDDGQIQKVGPPSLDAGGEEGKDAPAEDSGKGLLKVLKGPLPDYAFVIGEEEFRDGEKILREGGHGKWIWIILEGTVRVTRATPKGPVTLARLGEGCFLGTFTALTFKDYARGADVFTEGEVRVGLLDTERLSRTYGTLPQPFKELLLSLNTRLRKISEKLIELTLDEGKRQDIDQSLEVVIKKGATKEEVYSIQKGEVHIVGSSKRGILPLMTLGKEEVFGCIPFLDMGHEPRSASVLAAKDLEVKPLDVEGLRKEYESLPGTMKNLIYHLAMCIFSSTAGVYRLYEGR